MQSFLLCRYMSFPLHLVEIYFRCLCRFFECGIMCNCFFSVLKLCCFTLFYLKQIRLIKRDTFVRIVCFVVCCSVAFSHAQESPHRKEVSWIHLPATWCSASIEQNHFLLMMPCPPFHLKTLWSFCIAINHKVKGKGVSGWMGWGEWKTCIQVFCLWPTHQLRWQS